MNKKKYEKPSMKVVLIENKTMLLAGSNPAQPNNVPDYDDWLE